MRLFLLPYKTASSSARSLAAAMGVKRCTLERTTPNLRERHIINWGHSGHDLSRHVLSNATKIFNHPTKVAVAVNKRDCLQVLLGSGVSIPAFTTNRAEAIQWLKEGKEVVERHLLRGSGGEGIHIRNKEEDIQSAPLYTQYVKKKHEYRVHVIAGVVADVQRKAKRSGAEVLNWKIRNLESGFIFMRSGVEAPQCVTDQALLAMQASELDFGAVDVIYNAHEEKAYVLEINTACGLEGTTLDMYSDGLKAMVDGTPIKDWRHWQEAVEDNPVVEGDSGLPRSWTVSDSSQFFVATTAPVPTPATRADVAPRRNPYGSPVFSGSRIAADDALAVEATSSNPYNFTYSMYVAASPTSKRAIERHVSDAMVVMWQARILSDVGEDLHGV